MNIEKAGNTIDNNTEVEEIEEEKHNLKNNIFEISKGTKIIMVKVLIFVIFLFSALIIILYVRIKKLERKKSH